jgi:hypothetical protein
MSNPLKDKAEKFYVTKFLVTGSGRFPIDMLRYDRCVPATEGDSNGISHGGIPSNTHGRTIGLIRYSVAGMSGPNEARWKSFGWRVMRVEYSNGKVEWGKDVTAEEKDGIEFRAQQMTMTR